MYKLRWWDNTQVLRSKIFADLGEAIHFSIYKTPFQSMYGIDLIKE
jgi:hypothetical protein